ncbi:Ig-like domain-containing protein [Algoriphagus sp. A40]|uniref:Ig-like domain-containing protein n=1 Tax=Algoriphagus sp. A40 TaxID=1945863 RepID=UPI000984172E|nr:Ig-like domain-containing protein [Algoriphagus sp. A40]OOG68050.1 hypothetical protein B0E43_22625 [Algoriphagus sp. A40]
MEKSTQRKDRLLWPDLSMKKRDLVLTLFSILYFAQFGFATDYYISSSSGNDSRSASEAQNSTTPWKSIDKLNSVSSIFKGGDRILFKAGDQFYGTIKITKSGSVGAPILFTSYGTGNKPVITSMVKVSNLVSIGSGKYEADLSAFNLSRVQVVTINDQIKEVGRFPNTNAPDGGYLRIANVNSSTSFSTLSSNPYSGTSGDVVIRKNNWIIDRHAISNISGTSISFKANESHYSPLKNYGYFLQNHASLLDMPGEWSYDPATKKLTVNLSGYNMTTVNVSVATLDNLVTNTQYTTNLSFSNLHFKGSNSHLLNVSRSQNLKIENSLLEYAGENAVSAFDITGFLIQNNQINYALNSGIYISYGAPGAIIRGNTITNSFPFQGMAKNSDLAGIGIFLASDSDGSLIEKNNLINSGFNGIHFGGSYTKVINNFINNFCLYKQDGGGIYTNSDGFRDRNNVGREITGNIVINGKGTKLGTTEEVDMAEGIYLDDNSSGVKVSKNTIAFVTGKSIYLHNANNIEISDNLFFKSKSQVQFTHDFMGDPIRNVTVTRNQFSSVEKTNQIYSVYSALNDIGSVGSFNSNYFLDPFKNDFFIHTKGSSDGAVGVSRNLSNWASNYGYDSNSLKPDLNIPTYKITSSTLIKQSDFSSNTSIIAGVYGASSQLVSSGISGGTLKLASNSTNNATAYIQIGAIQTGQKILVEFDMKGTPANIPVELFLEGTFNIDKGSSNGIASTTSAAKNHQIILSSLTAKSNESIVLRFPPALTEMFLDNIKISKVTTEEIDKETLVYFDYNATGTAVQKSLDGTYVNAKNETFNGSITIPSYGSVLLAKVSETTTPVPNQSPTISLSKPTAGQIFIKGVNPVELVANAQDPEGKIKQVEFYNGTTLLAKVTAAPYSYNWTTIQNGNYSVSAKVIDQGDLSATSSSVNFTVKDPATNQAPTVSLSSPTAGQVFIKGVNPVQLVANAQDPEGKIKQVEFYNGTNLLATVTTAPFSYNWTTIQNGNYTVSAKVIDQENVSATSSAVSFIVKDQNTALPTYSAQMVSPINNSTIEKGSQPIILKTNALSSGLTVKKVEFFNWGYPLVTLTSGSFEFNWASIEVDSYSIYAKVTDNNGNVYTTTPIKFSVKAATTPSVSLGVNLSQPSNNQTFTLGQQVVKLKADVSSSTAIKNIEFFNWGFPLVTVSSSPFEFAWTKIEVGSYKVHAVITDINGIKSTSNSVNFNVVAASSTPTYKQLTNLDSTSAPANVVISQPFDNQIFELGKSTVVLKANTSEKVSKVEFFNWYQPLVSVTNDKNEYSWTKIEAGEYFVSARITDSKGTVIDSAPVRFKVIDSNSTVENETRNKLGLEENKDSSSYGIKMGPNPTTSDLNIFFEDYPENMEGKVSVLDLRGIELFKSDFNTNQETIILDLNFLKPGIYVVKLNFGNKIFQSHKLIKN